MSLRTYLLLMCFSTLLAWAGWYFVITNVQPGSSGMVGLGLFYVTLLVSMVGSLTVVGLLVRLLLFRGKGIEFREVRISFRHAVILSLVAVLALFLSSQEWLAWWTWVLLLSVASAIEALFLVLQQSRRS